MVISPYSYLEIPITPIITRYRHVTVVGIHAVNVDRLRPLRGRKAGILKNNHLKINHIMTYKEFSEGLGRIDAERKAIMESKHNERDEIRKEIDLIGVQMLQLRQKKLDLSKRLASIKVEILSVKSEYYDKRKQYIADFETAMRTRKTELLRP